MAGEVFNAHKGHALALGFGEHLLDADHKGRAANFRTGKHLAGVFKCGEPKAAYLAHKGLQGVAGQKEAQSFFFCPQLVVVGHFGQ